MPSTIRRLGAIVILISTLVSTIALSQTQPNDANSPDTRVLIDVSGSMKQNDPNNLRVPAVKLLVELLPKSSKAGFWLFAEDTKELVPITTINDQRKQKAVKAANKIHSRGLYTDIEKAIITATKDWKTNSTNPQRNLVILTDGEVDLAGGAKASNSSRQNILSKLVPMLQQQNAQVYTITLSDRADQSLLKKIAFDTGGWHEAADNAEQLQKSFVKIFNKAVPQDSVPLTGNKFMIDDSIKEFSILVFHTAGAKPTQLVDPKGKIYSAQQPETMNWRAESTYDLVTATNPISGEWHLDAAVDPDNQVFIVTDLKLAFKDLPNFVIENESINLKADLTEKGQRIIREDFLSLLDSNLQQTDDIQRSLSWPLKASATGETTYSQTVSKSLTQGTHQFDLIVNGQSFQRKARHTIQVLDEPIKSELKWIAATETAPAQVLVSLTPNGDVLDLRSVEVEAFSVADDGAQITLPMGAREGIWYLQLNAPTPGQRLVVNFNAKGRTLRGEAVNPAIKPVILDESAAKNLEEETNDQEEETTDIEEASDKTADIDEETQSTDADATDKESEEGTDWVTIGAVIGVNLLLIGGGYAGFRWYKKRSAQKQAEMVEKLES